jgi:hypothetical protein
MWWIPVHDDLECLVLGLGTKRQEDRTEKWQIVSSIARYLELVNTLGRHLCRPREVHTHEERGGTDAAN